MVKLVALYQHPDDLEAFDRHYREVHLPLARRMPGLRRVEVARVTGSPGGSSPYYLMAEMYFDDDASLQAALQSAEGRAAGKDLMGFAGKIVSLHIAEVVQPD
ncbi:Ethyl tert-butyl ether degradation EthD [Thermaerobacter marianensis DSM 12885]|uniref:Ethyl tert-butyl ether degradation EthD n=1 Tax=Thermaerobacter marianensis (strain ATCC 700841 / DSM 12885 / JCM 10246 / 7p75a) TaxID=644966 RepID=E6SK00_THEM7|nr:EthD family reductase [Thermaerobacter marianensis]ADU52233.1 Ethyl tert-butyl ether degradation EthD [Thermaerobacter marianensis DSM 12885]